MLRLAGFRSGYTPGPWSPRCSTRASPPKRCAVASSAISRRSRSRNWPTSASCAGPADLDPLSRPPFFDVPPPYVALGELLQGVACDPVEKAHLGAGLTDD